MKRKVFAIMLAVLMLAMLSAAAFADSIDGTAIAFSDWANAGFGSWAQSEDGVLSPAELTDFTLLRLEKDLGDAYTIEMDVKQDDTTSGWQTINIGFEVNEGENFTQSGFTLDLHNAGVARVINYSQANADAAVVGSYGNPYGQIGYVGNTEWRHIKITRDGNSFSVNLDNDPSQTISFTCDSVSGGHLVLGAVGSRMVSYKNIVITTASEEPEPTETQPQPTETQPQPTETTPTETQPSETPTNPSSGDGVQFVALAAALAVVGFCGIRTLNGHKKENV